MKHTLGIVVFFGAIFGGAYVVSYSEGWGQWAAIAGTTIVAFMGLYLMGDA